MLQMKAIQIALVITALTMSLSACYTHQTIVIQDKIHHLEAEDYGLFLLSNEGEKYVSYKDKQESYRLKSPPVLSFAHAKLLEYKKADYGKELKINFDKEGTAILEKVTSEHIGEKLAIVLGGKVIATPVVLDAISGGSVAITGLSENEMKAIFKELKMKSKSENN